MSSALAGRFFTTSATWESPYYHNSTHSILLGTISEVFLNKKEKSMVYLSSRGKDSIVNGTLIIMIIVEIIILLKYER